VVANPRYRSVGGEIAAALAVAMIRMEAVLAAVIRMEAVLAAVNGRCVGGGDVDAAVLVVMVRRR
jgi:hypothetical protein